MPHAGDRRLARLEDKRSAAGSPERRHRGGLRASVATCAVIREAVIAAGIDPAAIQALRRGEAAAAELAALGDTPDQQRADETADAADEAEWRLDGPDPRDELQAELARIARHYADGSTPDPAHSSLAEWLAWATMPGDGIESPPDSRNDRAAQ